MIFDLGHFWLITLNIFGWITIHLGISFVCSKIPVRSFNPSSRFFKASKIENKGKIYSGFFKIKKWKNLLPDGARLFKGGFPKKNLADCSPAYLDIFILETCRAEITHWLQVSAAPVFFLWNPWWAGVIMIAYALSVNMPCILLQRYNRLRLMRVLKILKA